ncbi:helix-turn-helix domain-containing protein [bacterium]|nr:helix-turn-helix domain-containing protein [bacterium]MDB4454956.1 helix-turn-helix domain-containing protein [bacterium]
METQTKMIKAHLDKGHSITAFEALKLYGCLRLASRMFDLKQSGYKFHKEMIIVGNGKRVAEYTKI